MYITLIYLQIDCPRVCCNFGIEDFMFYTIFIADWKHTLLIQSFEKSSSFARSISWFCHKASLSVFIPNQEVLKCLVVGIGNPGNFCLWIQESRVLESEIQLKDIGIPLTVGIRNPRSTNTESRIQDLKSGIPSMGSRIQGCLLFTQTPRMEFLCINKKKLEFDDPLQTYPNQLSRQKRVEKLHHRKTQPNLSKASKTEWREPLDFPTRTSGFPK